MNTSKLSSDSRTGDALSTNDTSDLREQVRVLGEDVRELGRLSKAAIAEKVGAAKNAAGHAVEYSRDKALEYRDVVAEKTREQPIKSLLIAAGVGAVIGLVLGRR